MVFVVLTQRFFWTFLHRTQFLTRTNIHLFARYFQSRSTDIRHIFLNMYACSIGVWTVDSSFLLAWLHEIWLLPSTTSIRILWHPLISASTSFFFPQFSPTIQGKFADTFWENYCLLMRFINTVHSIHKSYDREIKFTDRSIHRIHWNDVKNFNTWKFQKSI